MRKSIWIFLLAVLMPSAVLGWLALRSAEEQKIILERRTAQLCQTETENLAAGVRAIIEDQRRTFSAIVQKIVAGEEPEKVAGNFSSTLAEAWNVEAVGFVIGKEGRLLAPTAKDAELNVQCRQFLVENSAFLGNKVAVTVYPVPLEELTTTRADVVRKLKGYESKQSSESAYAQQRPMKSDGRFQEPPTTAQEPVVQSKDPRPARTEKLIPAAPESTAPQRQRKNADTPGLPKSKPQPQRSNADKKLAPNEKPVSGSPEPPSSPGSIQRPHELDSESQALLEQQQTGRRASDSALRNVVPQQTAPIQADTAPVSQLTWATTDFEALTSGQDEGVISRFVEDRLNLIFWLRLPHAPEWIFGCRIDVNALRALWPTALPDSDSESTNRLSGKPDSVLALLDDKARLVMSSSKGDVRWDWKRPFVATEIGEALPHWEATLYLRRPEALQESARGAWLTLLFLIVASIGSIACGGWLVVADARRQMALAQQKTDFVSNVSHELKTPLTSIRMFAELMHSGRSQDPGKFPQYLRIIMVEAERLTRLINNVLDFAKLERRQKRFDKKPLNLHRLIERLWESHELHLRESGFAAHWEAAEPPYPVIGDEDALAQILVNLLSNAEKYSGERKQITLHTYTDDGHICISVLDRGPGVPSGEERKIFEAFYRAHDSLSSGIQGSGLGLTLAQQLAREHGGEIVYAPRQGGGSNFTLKLPRADRNASAHA